MLLMQYVNVYDGKQMLVIYIFNLNATFVSASPPELQGGVPHFIYVDKMKVFYK